MAIARAIVHRPPLLLADEPTGNLDRATAAEVVSLLDKIHRELGATVVMVTHDEEMVCPVADRMVHLRDGRLHARGGRRAMRSWKIALLALGGLRRTPLRATLTALGVAIAGGALVSMMAFAPGIAAADRDSHAVALAAERHHRLAQREGQAKNAPVLDDAAVDRLAHLPGVAAAFPNIRVRGIKVRHDGKSESCLAAGIPREAALLGVSEEILVAGRFFSQGRRREAILGAQLVRSLGFASAQEAIGATLDAGGQRTVARRRPIRSPSSGRR